MSKARRRLRRTAIIGLEILAGATLGFLVLMGVTIWRLSEGPIAIDFLSDTIAEALSDPARGFNVGIGTTQLTWEGWQRGLDIHLIDVEARDGNGAVVAVVNDMTVAFSLRALAAGELAPTRLEVIAPSILLTWRADGSIGVGHGGSEQPVEAAAGEDGLMATIVDELMRPPDETRALGSLRSFEVRDANLVVHDEAHGATWETPGANMIVRRDESGLNVEAALAVKLGEEVTFFDISGYFNRGGETVRVAVGFDRIIPAALAGQSPYLTDLARFDLPVGGQIDTLLTADGADFSLRLDMAFPHSTGTVAAEGSFSLADETVTLDADVSGLALAELADRLPWLAPFAGFDVRVDGQSQLVVGPTGVESAGFGFRSGAGTVTLPDQLDEPLQVVAVTLEGAMAGNGEALDIANADIEFGTSRFVGAASGFADGAGGYDISVDGSLYELSLADAGRYWPSGLADGARRWVTSRVPDGVFTQVDIDLYGRLDAVEYSYDPVDTRIDFAFEGVALRYIEEMPPLTGMAGIGRYDGETLVVDVAAGSRTFDLEAGAGQVVIDGIVEGAPVARVSASLNGAARDHFRMLDHEPLDFLDGYGITPETVAGSGTVDMELRIDLDDNVAIEDIDVVVSADLRDATIPGLVADRTLTGGSLRIAADNDAMQIEGRGLVDGTEVTVAREERFRGGEFRARSTVSGVFDAAALAGMGLDVGRWVAGPVGLTAQLTDGGDGAERADIALDLSAATLSLPMLSWSKAPGAAATAEASLALADGRLSRIERFSVQAQGLAVAGSAGFAADGSFQSAALDRLAAHRTDTAGSVTQGADGILDVRFDRGVLDLKPLLDDDSEEESNPTQVTNVAVALERVWVSEDGYLSGVTGVAQLVGSTWFSGQLAATTTAGAPVALSLEPTESGRFLRLTSSDAGSLLADLGLVNSVRDGRLVVSARYRDSEPGRPLVGDLDISDFRLVDAPLLARVISIAGVTGILDALQGAGIGFGSLSTTFRFADGIIEFREGRMVGASLGITFDGQVDIDRDVVALEGAVAPAYAVNGILGYIPLVGDVLVGGEGEGIFALTYAASGAAGDPQVAVNPLSALTPGVLRNIFPGG